MSVDAVKAATRKVVELISTGRYNDAVKACSESRLSASDIEQVIKGYREDFVLPPNNFDDLIDLVHIAGSSVPAWSVAAPLWEKGKGRSDLSVELTITVPNGADIEIEFDDLRVP